MTGFHADSSELETKEILTWAEFGIAGRELARQITESGYRPEIVIAVARGGLLPAGHLAYALGVKLADAINVEFYTDVHETLPDPVLLAPMLDFEALRGKRLLVVDDVADSGRTLALVLDLLRGRGPKRAARCSTASPPPPWYRTSRGAAPTTGSCSRGPRNRRSRRAERRSGACEPAHGAVARRSTR